MPVTYANEEWAEFHATSPRWKWDHARFQPCGAAPQLTVPSTTFSKGANTLATTFATSSRCLPLLLPQPRLLTATVPEADASGTHRSRVEWAGALGLEAKTARLS